jgi:hypothetical protein
LGKKRWPCSIIDRGRQVGLATCAAKLGWLREYRQAIEHWSAALQVVEITESHVRRHGVYRGLVEQLQAPLAAVATSPWSARLRDRLLRHLAEQAEQTIAEEHLPASSEVLESLIGRAAWLIEFASPSSMLAKASPVLAVLFMSAV